MWRTPSGIRSLDGAEHQLIRELLGSVYDDIDLVDEPFEWGVRAFDALSASQRMAMLLEVGSALLDRHVPALPLTAVREATVATLFAALRGAIEFELDNGPCDDSDCLSWRRLLLCAYQEQCDDADHVTAECDEYAEWDTIIDSLAADLLWDRDWEMEDVFIDDNPIRSTSLKRKMGIPENYFTAIAPDPSDADLASIRSRLDAMTGASHNDVWD